MYAQYGKRVLDIFLGILAASILLLPMLFIGIAIKVDDPKGKVIFRQTRIGKDGKKFKILKFRSMKSETPKHLPNQRLAPEKYQEYVTRVGKWLRKTSIDELPQVFNIIKGDMSWVGPRPVLANETILLDAREAAGLRSFRPGLTGWAQINGRNKLTDEEKAAYDAEYVRKISFLFDFYCMLKTVPIVANKKGFSEGCEELDRHADFGTGDEFVLSEAVEEQEEEQKTPLQV